MLGTVIVRSFGVAATFAVALIAAALAVLGFVNGGVALLHIQGPTPLLALDLASTPLASPFLAIVAVLGTAVGIWGTSRGRPADVVLVAAFALAMVFVLVSQSVALFIVAWETMSLTSVFLVAAHHEERGVRRAAFTYLIVAQVGALCLIAALVILALQAGDASFRSIALHAYGLSPPIRDVVFILALIGFGSKAGALPLHFWLPRAHPVAPANASALLSGAMLKVAIYGLMLVTLQLAAPGPVAWGVTVVIVGTISAVVGVLYALVDHDLKRLLAYHSIENVGIILIGLGVALIAKSEGVPALAALATVAALFHCINHGVFKALLFLGAGTVAETAGTVDLERLGGLGGQLVWTAPLFLIGCAAISALPPFNGFASEWLTLQALVHGIASGARATSLLFVIAFGGLALTGGLAAACFVKVYGIAFLGRARRSRPRPIARESFDGSALSLALLGGLCVILGITPAVAVDPLVTIAGGLVGSSPIATPTLPILPASLVVLPILGAIAASVLAHRRGVIAVPTWTCGSPVTPAAQYTATAFSKPLRTIFGFILRPERALRIDKDQPRWFPSRMVYRTQSRYIIDETARRGAAAIMRFSRRSRAVQSGNLRLYVAYALAAIVIAVLVTR